VCSVDRRDLIERTYAKNLPAGIEIAFFNDPESAFDAICRSTAQFGMIAHGGVYINVPKLARYLSTFDPAHPHYIGGHGDLRTVLGKPTYFHSAGPGYVLSRPAIEALQSAMQEGASMGAVGAESFEVFVGYLSEKLGLRRTTSSAFQNCNWRGYCHNGTFGCHVNRPFNRIFSCNHMSDTDFDEWTQILEQNHYYVDENIERFV
jgi:hypothetical protein